MTFNKPEPEGFQEDPNWKQITFIAIAFVLLGFVILVLVQYGVIRSVSSEESRKDYTLYGLSGDFFGFANAVFSAFAFAILIVTLWMQKHELSQQRRELKLTQDIFKQQEQEMAEQNKSLRQQTLENTLFNLIDLHLTIVNGMKYVDTKISLRSPSQTIMKEVVGRSSFPKFFDELKRILKTSENIHEAYKTWYPNRESELGHYFRSLYNMMRYIDEQGNEQAVMYSRLVRSQLSREELGLLFYNGLGPWGAKFKPLIERYALLKHLSTQLVPSEYYHLYETAAFGSNYSNIPNQED